jgi:hypothetical protein
VAADLGPSPEPAATNAPAQASAVSPALSRTANLREWLVRTGRRLLDWTRALRVEHWWVAALAVVFVVSALVCLAGRLHFYLGDIGDGSNRLYLYSTLAEALATILALLVTATLVATQLAAQSFTPRVVRYRIRDPWLWGAVAVYGLGILASFAGLARSGLLYLHTVWQQRLADLAVLLACAALLYTVPFAVAVLRSLESDSFIAWLMKKGEYEGLEDFMRKATNEGLVRQLELAMRKLPSHAASELFKTRGDLEVARKFASLGTRLGRYAATHKDPEGITVAMDYLTAMTQFCTEGIYRAAADVFNESVRELETAAEEAFGQ